MSTTTADQLHRAVGGEVEESNHKVLHCGDGIKLPGLIGIVDPGLVGFGLIASQVRIEAWESGSHQSSGTIRPFELTEEILCELALWLPLVDAGVLINLGGDQGVHKADPRITMNEARQL